MRSNQIWDLNDDAITFLVARFYKIGNWTILVPSIVDKNIDRL